MQRKGQTFEGPKRCCQPSIFIGCCVRCARRLVEAQHALLLHRRVHPIRQVIPDRFQDELMRSGTAFRSVTEPKRLRYEIWLSLKANWNKRAPPPRVQLKVKSLAQPMTATTGLHEGLHEVRDVLRFRTSYCGDALFWPHP